MNAVERVASSTGPQCDSARKDLALSENQLRDYEARLGKPFPHSAYRADLAELRDRLKLALSSMGQEAGAETAPNAQDLADRIRALKVSYTLDSPPQAPRLGTRSPTAERPVTARIRERQEPALPSEADEGPTTEAPETDHPGSSTLEVLPSFVSPSNDVRLPSGVREEPVATATRRGTQRRMF